jgi:hypothetical protein
MLPIQLSVMPKPCLPILLFFWFPVIAFTQSVHIAAQKDWLVHPTTDKAQVILSKDNRDIILNNGLVQRTLRVTPDLACIDYKNLVNGQQLLRAIKPEARITLDGIDYSVGGLSGQKENAYLLPEWVDKLHTKDSSFHYVSYSVSDIRPFLHWKTDMWSGSKQQPTGKVLSLRFQSALPALKGVEVSVQYELYDGIPLICKWVSITNNSAHSMVVDHLVNEILGMVEEESAVVGKPEQMKKPSGIYIETNYAFNNAMRYDISDQTIHWKTDAAYTSQVNYNYETPCLLEIYPDKAPGIELKQGEEIKSVRTYELLMDSYDRERRGLAVRKMYRTIAPWTNTNPIFMHLVSRNDEQVRTAIDQCVATGYEALILSFGSHCNMEDTSAENIMRWRLLADYAHSKHIYIGSYSLFSSRTISAEDDVINPATGKPGGAFFGNAPCMGSRWGLAYLSKLKTFMHRAGFDIFENDGPYPGDVCASTTHPGHTGLKDSQWKQMELQKSLYHWCSENGIYVNAPDWYFLDGTNKIAIGYREVNFSLPREQQMILNRQNIFDGTWEKTPSMGWGFVPLTKYQGGGAEAVLEPLSEHLKDYEQLMVQYYGAGVQACYRGPRLFDTDATKATVSKVVSWYKQYRDILNSDIIHLRRADGRDWDGILHVNPQLNEKGFMLLYNPLKEKITRTIKVPLYYTGLTKEVTVISDKAVHSVKTLNRDYSIDLSFTIEPESYTWFILQK